MENLKSVIAICVAVIVCISIICISTNYDNRLKKEIMLKCLELKVYDCKS